ncbi:hypothetical protein HK104_009996 [Borealophlyctis nickersoniae]|nr:hypothetical protein HK104_009996 [Borealophlyctis nickersoniae]
MLTPAGFMEGCEELVQWCNDRRAYLPELANELDKTLKHQRTDSPEQLRTETMAGKYPQTPPVSQQRLDADTADVPHQKASSHSTSLAMIAEATPNEQEDLTELSGTRCHRGHVIEYPISEETAASDYALQDEPTVSEYPIRQQSSCLEFSQSAFSLEAHQQASPFSPSQFTVQGQEGQVPSFPAPEYGVQAQQEAAQYSPSEFTPQAQTTSHFSPQDQLPSDYAYQTEQIVSDYSLADQMQPNFSLDDPLSPEGYPIQLQPANGTFEQYSPHMSSHNTSFSLPATSSHISSSPNPPCSTSFPDNYASLNDAFDYGTFLLQESDGSYLPGGDTGGMAMSM